MHLNSGAMLRQNNEKMIYRRLTNEELVPLEKKFIQFLVSNTITGDDWAKMKERRPKQAMGLIDIFSDIVFEETLKKIAYLRQSTPKTLNMFHFTDSNIELLGLVADEQTDIDFTKDDSWLQKLQKLLRTVEVRNPDSVGKGGVSFLKTEKKYTEQRELEIFKMLENGCRITDNFLYDMLLKLS